MDLISGWCKSQRCLDGFTVVITGSNTGLGKETALDLYCRGARVIMACRDVQKGETAKKHIEEIKRDNATKGSLVVEKLDLGSLKSVREFVARVVAKEPKIQILINNAGVMMCPEGETEDRFETHIGTNHIGHALLTLLLMPTLMKSAPSRIIFLTSYVHEKDRLDLEDMNFKKTLYDPFKAYARSKSANILFATALSRKLKEHGVEGVTTYSVHPGVIATDIGRHFSEIWPGATWLFNYVLSWFLKSPRCGVQTTIYCAVDEACENESGLYYKECAPAQPSSQCRDEAEVQKCWDVTIQELKLKEYNPFDMTSVGPAP